jgi:hypothetical protein
MSRRQNFTQTQLRIIAKIAREQQVSVRLEPSGSVTISPLTQSETGEKPGLEAGLESWDDPIDFGGARSRTRKHRVSPAVPAVDRNSRTVVSGRYVWDFEEFKAHIATKPLNQRELAALALLARTGVGKSVSPHQVKIGLETQERLEARGYIETRPKEKFPDRVGYYILTADGSKAWGAQSVGDS